MNGRVFVLLGVSLLLLFTVQVGTAHASSALMFAHWNHPNITYRIASPECDVTWYDMNHYKTFDGLQTLNASLAQWHQWLPEVSFTQTTSDQQEDVTILCVSDGLARPRAYAWSEITYGPNQTIVAATMHFGAYSLTQFGINCVDHEVGNVLGLIENTGGVTDWKAVWHTMPSTIAEPTPEQLTELHAAYGSLPTPEFPYPALLFGTLLPVVLVLKRKTPPEING